MINVFLWVGIGIASTLFLIYGIKCGAFDKEDKK